MILLLIIQCILLYLELYNHFHNLILEYFHPKSPVHPSLPPHPVPFGNHKFFKVSVESLSILQISPFVFFF